jgi:hypothetical protein
VSDLHAGFQRADADARGDGLFAFLERVDGLPHVQAIKRRMTELLGPSAGQHLLEVGCGMGHEIRRLAGRVAPPDRHLTRLRPQRGAHRALRRAQAR